MAVSFGGTSSLLREGAALLVTSAPVRDPLADYLLTPENAALLLIDYQPHSWPGPARWTAGCWSRTPSRRSRPSRPSKSRSCTPPSTSPPAGNSQPLPDLAGRLSTGPPPPQPAEILAIAEKWRPHAAWRPAPFSAAFEPAEAPPAARQRSAYMNDGCTHRPDPRCHALVPGLRGLPGPGTPGLGASADLRGTRSRRML